jgi:hypothetical protein
LKAAKFPPLNCARVPRLPVWLIKPRSWPADQIGKKTQAGFLGIFLSLICSADGVRRVDYDVDGTAKYANLTFTNEKGGTDQKQVKLPYHNEFYVRAGSVLSLGVRCPRT